jgi:Pyruvate/2-oxoacid:ferredoxin oxidoreductase delta subunit
MARPVIARGLMRRSDRKEVLEVKRQAEEHGQITWMCNTHDDWRGNISCSCCGCCCHALRYLSQFNAPGFISRPHFLPRREISRCNDCKRCVRVCPMGAWTDGGGTSPRFESMRCVGCGLCVAKCKQHALDLQPVQERRPVENGWASLVLRTLPSYLSTGTRVWARRLLPW